MGAGERAAARSRIADVRRAKGLSEYELADLCGIEVDELLAYERGEPVPTAKVSRFEMALCIGEAMQCDVGQLYELVVPGTGALAEVGGNIICRLADARREYRVTQKKLADLCRSRVVVTNKAIQKIEHGEAEPTLEAALAIATALGCGVGEVFERRMKGGMKSGAKPVNLMHRTFGRLTVVARAEERGRPKTLNGQAVWLCRCACGSMVEMRSYSLRGGGSRSCGCAEREKNDLKGRVYGKLTVKEQSCPTCRQKKRRSDRYWLCECECGGQVIVRASHLNSGHTTSCGCEVPDGFIARARVQI